MNVTDTLHYIQNLFKSHGIQTEIKNGEIYKNKDLLFGSGDIIYLMQQKDVKTAAATICDSYIVVYSMTEEEILNSLYPFIVSSNINPAAINYYDMFHIKTMIERPFNRVQPPSHINPEYAVERALINYKENILPFLHLELNGKYVFVTSSDPQKTYGLTAPMILCDLWKPLSVLLRGSEFYFAVPSRDVLVFSEAGEYLLRDMINVVKGGYKHQDPAACSDKVFSLFRDGFCPVSTNQGV